MNIRKFAIAAIAASVVLGTSACTFVSPIASRIQYAPSDGSQIDLGDLKLRNFVYVTNGEKSALTGSVVNTSADALTLKIEYTDSAVSEIKTVALSVAANQKLDLGYNGGAALAIAMQGKAGDIVTIKVSEGSGIASALNVPVLDGTFDYYRNSIDSLAAVTPSAK